MIFGTVQHVSGVNELVTRTSNSQLRLGVAQNDFSSENPAETHISYKLNHTHTLLNKQHIDKNRHVYFASQAMGVKSSLCLVLKIMFLVLISRMAGGCRGVAMANRAS